MVHASYTHNEDIYEVQLIEDISIIADDIASIEQTISVKDKEAYLEAMEDCINQKLAFSVIKNGTRVGFMYNRIHKRQYEGCSIYLPSKIVMILAFKTVFELCNYGKIRFTPHEGQLNKFKSLTTKDSIRRHKAIGGPINVYKHLIYPIGEKLFYYMRIKEYGSSS